MKRNGEGVKVEMVGQISAGKVDEGHVSRE